MAFSLKDFSDIRKVGEGGMGNVYIATQVSLGRKVIIKELASNLHKDAKLIKMFENEARSAAALDHDNIIRLYDFGADNGSFFISMEFVDGPDLQQLMHWQPFPTEIGLMVLLQAVKGLDYAHRQGTIHCDVKPSNILISKTGKVKVLDFGLAQAVSNAADNKDASSIFITPGYMAPEVASGTAKQDVRVDIWAVGVLAYRLLCGKLPFASDSVRTVIYSIVHDKEQDIQQRVPAMRDDLAQAVRSCLQKDPKKRLGSLDPLIESLENYFFDLGIRDSEKEIEKFVGDKEAASAELYNLLASYHMQKGNEYLSDGDAARSDIHFREAEKFGFRDMLSQEFAGHSQNSRITPRLSPRDILAQAAAQSADRSKSGKSRSSKTAAIVVGILCLASLGAAPAIMFSQKSRAMESKGLLEQSEKESIARASLHTHPAVPPAALDTEKELLPEYASLKHELTPIAPDDQRPEQAPPRTSGPTVLTKETSVEHRSGASRKDSPYGVLVMAVEPAQASVFLDAKKAIPKELTHGKRLAAGPHAVYAIAEGYAAYSASITIRADASQIVTISLKQLEKGVGLLHVHSYPWADIYVDDSFQGTTPLPKPLSLSEGDHQLTLKREGFKPYSETVHVARGEVTRVKIQLEQ
jgi:serine/threonine protein kinase